MTDSKASGQWWQAAYPYAVLLEKHITGSPEEFTLDEASDIIIALEDILPKMEQLSYSESDDIMRGHLLRATHYLIYAYQEKLKENQSEVDFHYSNALMQVAQLHHQLVLNGIAN